MSPRTLLPRLERRPLLRLLALLLLAAVPALLLRDTLFSGKDYVPFDLTTFPPWSIGLDEGELQARREGSNWDVTEKTLLVAPEYRLALREIREGRFPHWNPYARFGGPLFANSLDGFAYPTHWLFFRDAPERGFGVAAWIAFFLAGVFMLGFLRAIGLHGKAALFGAMVFQLSGTLTANGHFFMRMETLIWLPAGFWALTRLAQARGLARVPPFCGLAVSVALCWLAGFAPYALGCSLLFGLYLLYQLWLTARGDGAGMALRFGALASGALALGLGVAGIQLLPMLEYFPHSQRELTQSVSRLAEQGFDPMGWIGFLLPSPYGDPRFLAEVPADRNPLLYLLYSRSDPTTGKLFLPQYVYTEYAVYLGVFPLVFVLLSFLGRSVRFRGFALAALVFLLVFSMGGWLHRAVSGLPAIGPVFQSTPPYRFMGPLCFLGAALAATGFENGPRLLSSRRRLVLSGMIGLLLVACLALLSWASPFVNQAAPREELMQHIADRWASVFPGLRQDPGQVTRHLGPYVEPAFAHVSAQALQAAGLLLFALIWVLVHPGGERRFSATAERLTRILGFAIFPLTLFEMLGPAGAVNPCFPHRELRETDAHRFLRERDKEFASIGGVTVAHVSSVPDLPKALPSNLLMDIDVRALNAYAFLDGQSHKAIRALYGPEQMIRGYWFRSFPADSRLDLPLFDLYGVRYLMSVERLDQLGAPVLTLDRPDGEPGLLIYERRTALPRAFLVANGVEGLDEAATVARLTAEDFDPRREVLLHEVLAGTEDGMPADDRAAVLTSDPAARYERIKLSNVRFHEDTPDRIHLEITYSPGAWLVLADSAVPTFEARLDGTEVQIRRADSCFRAVWIPEGDHELVFEYDASSFRSGLRLSALSLGLLLLLMAWWNGSPKGRQARKREQVALGDRQPEA